jgi:hypothetical protein
VSRPLTDRERVILRQMIASLEADPEQRLFRSLRDRFDVTRDFEEAWRGSIEEDWQRQRWPTFKAMAADIFEHGFEVALWSMLEDAGLLER